jgi:hypothetical protein
MNERLIKIILTVVFLAVNGSTAFCMDFHVAEDSNTISRS